MPLELKIWLTALLFALGSAHTAGAAKIFKWVDEKGVTHYGESIPPEYKNQAASEMSKHGVTVRKVDAAATTEQRRAAQERALKEREEKQRAFEQRRRDMALINTYTSAREIDDHRDRTLQMPIQAIKGLEPRLKKARERLAALHKQAATLAQSGKTPHDGLEQDIQDGKAEVDSIQADIDRNQAQMQAIKSRFDADRKRFIELTQR